MPAIDYDATMIALTMPGERDSVLGMPGFTGTSVEALCAECARLAYVGFDRSSRERQRLDDSLATIGMAPSTVIVDAGTDTQAFGSTLPDGRRIVAFRGTQPNRLKDLITDGKASMVPWISLTRVHQGFSEAFTAIRPSVAGFLAGGGGAVVTGHSLGAALATLAASVFPGAALVTFGSPRVGDQAFVDLLGNSAHSQRRYVDCCDVIPTLPPPFPGFYVHSGDEIYVDRSGVIPKSISIIDKAMDRVAANCDYGLRYTARHGDVPVREFADHAPINYVRAFS